MVDYCFDKSKITEEINLNLFNSFINENDKNEFFGECGHSHYRFLAYISTFFYNSTIFDFSTDAGLSALALSYNETNEILSYGNGVNRVKNIKNNMKIDTTLLIDDAFLKTYKNDILNSPVVFVDLHPHEGNIEFKIYEFLKLNDYKGLIIFDDIWYFKTMRDNLWYKIEEHCRMDVTEFSHWSGLGLVSFNKNIQEQFNQNKPNVDNWTLMTAYFNLTNCYDASTEIKARDKKYYFSHSYSTLALPYNLVIYCDEESYDEIIKIRPEYLKNKTQYKICDFEEFCFVKNGVKCNEIFFDYRQQIIKNREGNPFYFDNRMNASYYLFCMARYTMLKEVITENYFNSTHFAWINFCIERMGFRNLVHLEECLSVNRNKFSTCYINYIPEKLIKNLPEYFKWGRCSMCSGFFTGNSEYMYKVCDLIEDKFLQFLKLGYGHADEQLFSPVYFENPHLFEHYYGDYHQMITNYKYIYDAPEPPIYNFIRNSFLHKNYEKCLEGCIFVMNSLKLNKCRLNEEFTRELQNYYTKAMQILKDRNENVIQI